MKAISVLAHGSIGTQTLDIARTFLISKVVALTAGRNLAYWWSRSRNIARKWWPWPTRPAPGTAGAPQAAGFDEAATPQLGWP